MFKPRFLIFFAFLTVLWAVPASAEVVFRDLSLDSLQALPSRGDREMTLPGRFRVLEVDIKALESVLDRAPEERTEGTTPLLLTLPYPDGTDKVFRVEESPIMEPALAASFPEIRTFTIQGISDPTATGRLSLTSLGFQAMVLSDSGTVLIDPYRRWDTRYVLSYFKSEARKPAGAEFRCGVDEKIQGTDEPSEIPDAPQPSAIEAASGTQLRTYRLALAATGEYSTAVCAPNPVAVSCAMNAMVASVNRVVGIYEREVAVRMVLVGNDNLLVYTDGGTDPYTNEDGIAMLAQNQSNINSVIGSANYDIGHVFSTGGGGVASASPCSASSKARGVTGLSNPVGDPFDVDYVAHEMGHQYGAAHTFNGTTSNCGGGNRSSGSAYEPGSGTTIMAYAGICGAENIQPHSDPTFHTRSFDQIVTSTTTGAASSCPVVTATGNLPPTVNAGGAFTIPKQTPFTLTGSASDPDGDPLTYMWEEFDLGSAAPPNDDVSAVRPIFRSFVPLTIPSRTFPQISDILGNVATLGEALPTRNRTMVFRMTARDNRAGGGGVNYASTNITVNAAAGPFLVTQPNTAVDWPGLSGQMVTWDVAGTSVAPVSCANVSISLSNDGGGGFPTVLLASTPNDGAESVTIPNLPTTKGRVRVSCVGNIFFDISNTDFTISGTGGALFYDGFEGGTTNAWSGTGL